MSEAILSLIWLPTRVAKGQKDLITVQFVLQFFSSLAIAVATACYLWYWETDTFCASVFRADDVGKVPVSMYIDVSSRFENILKIWWAFALADMFRCVCVFGYLIYEYAFLAWTYYIFALNDLFGCAALIILHVYRYEYSG